MQRNLRNLAIALVAGTFAVTAGRSLRDGFVCAETPSDATAMPATSAAPKTWFRSDNMR